MPRDLDDKDFRVVGIGTRMSRDDEIGLRLVERLMETAEFAGRCELLESADAATVTSYLMEQESPVLFVDCADMGLLGGEYRFFGEKDATVHVRADSVSTHGMGLAEGLALARALDYGEAVRFFAVQPFDLSPCFGITEEMSARFELLLGALTSSALAMRASIAPAEENVV